MIRTSVLTNDMRLIIKLHKNGKRHRKIAQDLHLPVCTAGAVARKWTKYDTTGDIQRSDLAHK